MYMTDGTCLKDLELLLGGYAAALQAHDIQNDLIQFNSKFNLYVYQKMHWSISCGWAHAINDNCSSPEVAVEKFFSLVNEFVKATSGIEGVFNVNDVGQL